MKQSGADKSLKSNQLCNLKRAWLLSWIGNIGLEDITNNDIIAIVDARREDEFIEDLVDILYCRNENSAYEMASLTNKRSKRRSNYRSNLSSPSRIYYGTTAMIYARRVINLTVERDEEQKKEYLSWTEPAVLGNSPSGGPLIEVHPSRDCKFERLLKPLALEILDN
jgi:hypothetical protein